MACSKIKLFAVALLTVTSLNNPAQSFRISVLPVQVSASIRGLSVVNNKIAWVSGSNGTIGITTDGGLTWDFKTINEPGKYDFRTLYAFNDREAIIANAGSPASILRTDDGFKTWSEVYRNEDDLCFFDGADFWDAKNGIIYGDPLDGHMFLMITRDGGKTWKELPAECRPAVTEGEASFAASGTGIRCFGKRRVAMITGGAVSRLHISEDRGKTWNSSVIPIVQGEATTGAVSVAFNGGKNTIIVGGDYTNDSLKLKHVCYTSEAGAEWSAPVQPTGGFRECVIYTDHNTAIAVGPGGMDYSDDGGIKWQSLSPEKGLHVVSKARNGNLILAAGNGKIIIITRTK